jgi:hypothetical protein
MHGIGFDPSRSRNDIFSIQVRINGPVPGQTLGVRRLLDMR